MIPLLARARTLVGPNASALAAPLFIVMVLAMMVLPLPPFALDLLFTFNIAMALMVMMVAAHMVQARSTSRPSRRCCCSPRCCGCR